MCSAVSAFMRASVKTDVFLDIGSLSRDSMNLVVIEVSSCNVVRVKEVASSSAGRRVSGVLVGMSSFWRLLIIASFALANASRDSCGRVLFLTRFAIVWVLLYSTSWLVDLTLYSFSKSLPLNQSSVGILLAMQIPSSCEYV